MINLTPVTRSDCDSLAHIDGARLSGVTYHYLPPPDESGYSGGEIGVDCDLAAVELDLGERGTATITWAMSSTFEGLAVLTGESYPGVATETLDAADRDAWRDCVGSTITSVAASWQVSDPKYPESLWAARINCAAGSIVIALGTVSPGIEYMPDELVVIFDVSLARSYKPHHVNESSWGTPIGST
jgi:hypothetical protein